MAGIGVCPSLGIFIPTGRCRSGFDFPASEEPDIIARKDDWKFDELGRPVMTHNVQPGVAPEMQLLTADELARLRELACTPRKSWWTDYGMLLAIAGFALSLATGIISAYVGYRKDIHDQQAQLASVLQTIQELTIKEAEVYEKYKGTAYEETATTLITTDINTALKTATRLAFSLGSNA